MIQAPARVWTDGTTIVTASPTLAAEMRALGDTVIEYIRVDLLAEAERTTSDAERTRE